MNPVQRLVPRELFQRLHAEGEQKPWLNNWSVLPEEDWNYAFVEGAALKVEQREIGDYPFSPEGAPVVITTKGKKVAWGMEKGTCTAEPSMEWIGEQEEELRLIPYGCTNLRITELPVVK